MAKRADTGPGSGGVPAVRFDMTRVDRLREVLDAFGYAEKPPPAHARLAAAGEGVRVTLYEIRHGNVQAESNNLVRCRCTKRSNCR